MLAEKIKASRILIVDDEDANVRLLQLVLERDGFEGVTGTTDPREDVEAWRREADGAPERSLTALAFPFGGGGPDGLRPDSFGTLAETELRLPAGSWELVTRSDDGIRVWADGELVIDDWTHHATTEHRATLDLDAEQVVHLRVEHFELDGGAHLSVEIRQRD